MKNFRVAQRSGISSSPQAGAGNVSTPKVPRSGVVGVDTFPAPVISKRHASLSEGAVKQFRAVERQRSEVNLLCRPGLAGNVSAPDVIPGRSLFRRAALLVTLLKFPFFSDGSCAGDVLFPLFFLLASRCEAPQFCRAECPSP